MASKKKPTAILQIVNQPESAGSKWPPIRVFLEPNNNCTSIAQYGIYLQEKINKCAGMLMWNYLLPGQVKYMNIFLGDIGIMSYGADSTMDLDLEYTFRFMLTSETVDGIAAAGPNPTEEMANQMAKLKKENAILEQDFLEEKKQKLVPITEYANLIVVPVVTNLRGHYEKAKLLRLIQHGNSITKRLYIKSSQQLNDAGLIQGIVDLMATAKKPGEMIGDVLIEYTNYSGAGFTWPKRGELTLKKKSPNLDVKYEEASGAVTLDSASYKYLAEYELVGKDRRFQVCLVYDREYEFDKSVAKFFYRHLA